MIGSNPTPRRRQFSIGALMLSIAGVALVLGLIRPIAWILSPLYPEFGKLIEKLATVEMGLVLCGLLIVAFAIYRLMAEDEAQ